MNILYIILYIGINVYKSLLCFSSIVPMLQGTIVHFNLCFICLYHNVPLMEVCSAFQSFR